MISEGEKINTDFELEIVEDGEEKTVTFGDLLNRPTIVSVYMRNNTPGCDKQNKSLAEHAQEFDELGYNLIAVSKDSCKSHKRYAEKFDINYILASDPEYNFANAVDSVVEKNMFGNTYKGPTRSAYLFDTDGTVKGIIEKIDTKNHANELMDLIKAIQ